MKYILKKHIRGQRVVFVLAVRPERRRPAAVAPAAVAGAAALYVLRRLGRGSGLKAGDVAHGIGEIALASPLFLFAPLYRRWHLRWGASDAEVAAPMPGDELVPDASLTTTRAVTIDASPEDVWPWLVQIGYGKAGFYSYDLFDNAGRPSADQILPEHQHPRIGDWMPMAAKVNETTAFTIKTLETNRVLLWEKPHSTWAWKLEPLPDGRTRLVTRLKDRYSWREDPTNAVLSLILFEFGDFPMMRKLLLGVKRRSEQRAMSKSP